MAYFDLTNTALKHAEKVNGFWQPLQIDNSGDVGRFTSITAGPGGRTFISYYDNLGGNLKVATREDGVWQLKTLDPAGDAGRGTSIRLDPAGLPHLTYYERDSGDLLYAAGTGASGSSTPWPPGARWGGSTPSVSARRDCPTWPTTTRPPGSCGSPSPREIRTRWMTRVTRPAPGAAPDPDRQSRAGGGALEPHGRGVGSNLGGGLRCPGTPRDALHDGPLREGAHALRWSGRDRAGRRVTAAPTSSGRPATRRQPPREW